MGVDTNWLLTGSFEPPTDAELSYKRTLSGQRPYGYLMNTDFGAIGGGGFVERYFQVCLFYGIYPSFFSPSGLSSNYWEDSKFYERDRPLFVKYIPLIRQMNTAGWQPIPYARSSDAQVLLERYGQWPLVHVALRNMKETQ